jgi:hypothetical protein
VCSQKKCSNEFVAWWRWETSPSVHPSILCSTSRSHSIFLARTSFHHRVTSLKGSASQNSAFRVRRIPHVLCVYFYVAEEEGTLCLADEVYLSDINFNSVKVHCPLFVFYEDLARPLANAVQNLRKFAEYIFVAIVQSAVHIYSAYNEDKYIRLTRQDLWTQRSTLKTETL